MEDKQFYNQLDEIMQELLPGVAHVVLSDYGKLNDVCREITRRRVAANAELKIEVEVTYD